MQRHFRLNLPFKTPIYIVQLYRDLYLAVFLVEALPLQPSFRLY
jgi:hypothetical protein